MLEKLFGKKHKDGSRMLKVIGLAPSTAHQPTRLTNLMNLVAKFNPKAPSASSLLKILEKQEFTVESLLKCAALAHFLVQHEEKKAMLKLTDFVDVLRG
jgi:hypothetical protein